ncbi:MAG: transcriptional regulator [Bdellovibrio sp. CG12_big_fil_rev_8_21_14_0_65_39_13]|nr:MAG: transcriptional regulator [Bdellovibrio sp. CG22_combo_CG10-13_8_21_14_all_39_27]PIQ58455.1 MAG: transcriptional regulator [Bdellovibrio sp. CG12_big_fil_rev_8_21_14_0_65_39_13]PIR35408.1 MAG: transcriptional regulator [Bdellovibrio sp. CG11_big_fil_rev_8_21_14_0_20_39_38]PJB52869.1 MAG: transcriptional regulator [Bdellovibrio sp. CG_4_9_14_3_um_filter_39_7]
MKFLLPLLLILSQSSFATDWVDGQKPQVIKLEGKEGAKLDGSAWSSDESLGKVTMIFYVDPDVKDKNDKLGDALSAKKYSKDKISYFGIINMAATWMPNFILNEALKQKQKKYTDTVYVKDFTKKLVKEWSLPDDENNVLLFDREGKLLWHKFGLVEESEIPQILELIEKNF